MPSFHWSRPYFNKQRGPCVYSWKQAVSRLLAPLASPRGNGVSARPCLVSKRHHQFRVGATDHPRADSFISGVTRSAPVSYSAVSRTTISAWRSKLCRSALPDVHAARRYSASLVPRVRSLRPANYNSVSTQETTCPGSASTDRRRNGYERRRQYCKQAD